LQLEEKVGFFKNENRTLQRKIRQMKEENRKYKEENQILQININRLQTKIKGKQHWKPNKTK